jgi:hypothetical protein
VKRHGIHFDALLAHVVHLISRFAAVLSESRAIRKLSCGVSKSCAFDPADLLLLRR